jgi:hypothetical protein
VIVYLSSEPNETKVANRRRVVSNAVVLRKKSCCLLRSDFGPNAPAASKVIRGARSTFYVGPTPATTPSEDFAPGALPLIEHLDYPRANRGRLDQGFGARPSTLTEVPSICRSAHVSWFESLDSENQFTWSAKARSRYRPDVSPVMSMY